MKKLFAAFLVAICFMMMPSVYAEKTDAAVCEADGSGATAGVPCYDSEKNYFFANGASIVITDSEEADGKTLITWGEGKSQLVPQNVTVFGGMHNNDTEVSTDITMKSGKVHGIFGGGLHKSKVSTASIEMTGGTAVFIMGGGTAGYKEDSDSANDKRTLEDALAGTTLTTVGDVKITISGEAAPTDVYGGGESYAYTGHSSITVTEDFEGSIDYVTSGGSNGYTEDGDVYLAGGTINVVQAVNRGYMKDSTVIIDGATVTTVYAAAAGNEANTGIQDNASVTVLSGKVTNVNPGYNDGEAMEGAVLTYVEGTVDTIDESLKSAKVYGVIFWVEDEPVPVIIPEDLEGDDLKNYIIDQIYKTLEISKEDYTIKGFYTTKDYTDEFDLSALEHGDEVYVNIVEVENPDTSDIDILAIGILAVAGFGGAVALRRKLAHQR